MSDVYEIAQLIKDCVNRKSKMTCWEKDFISEISDQFDSGLKPLSEKQISILEEIWDSVT